MNTRHPNNPGLWLNPTRLGMAKGDAYDDVGDPWRFCKTHQQWFGGYCSDCHPTMDKCVTIGATVVAIVTIILFIGFVFALCSSV